MDRMSRLLAAASVIDPLAACGEEGGRDREETRPIGRSPPLVHHRTKTQATTMAIPTMQNQRDHEGPGVMANPIRAEIRPTRRKPPGPRMRAAMHGP
jgi:hypothetical protein